MRSKVQQNPTDTNGIKDGSPWPWILMLLGLVLMTVVVFVNETWKAVQWLCS